MRRIIAVLLAGLALCVVAAAPGSAQTRSYTVDAKASTLRILLERDGIVAILAHDHVLVADGFGGRVTVNEAELAKSSLQLSVPVASLLIDPPDVRRELGLAGKLDDDDRAEIKEALLAADQLDGANFPRVVAILDGVTGKLPDLVLSLRVRIRQTERILTAPTRVRWNGTELNASGSFELLQSDFGIEPFSALLGMIAVQDRVRVTFRIVARADSG